MTMRALTILGFVVLFVAAAVLVAASRRYRERLATFAEAVDAVGRRRGTRLGLVLIWAWLGWHFLAR